MTTSASAHQPCDVDVIVCGGGPVGLSLTYLLGRAGLRVAMFERRASTTTLPKGQYVHASTGELFKQWGVWDLLHDAGWTTESSNGQGFYVNVAHGPVASIRAIEGSHEDYVRKWELLSPVYPRKVPASEYESAIRRQAARWPGAQMHFGTRVVDVQAAADAVQVTVQDVETQARRSFGARYLVACDGAHSFVRSRVGGGQDHGPTFGNQILVEFRADLQSTLGRDGFFHSFILHPHHAGWFGSQHPATGLWRYSFRHDEEELPSPALVLERLRGALGMPHLPVEIVRFHRFDYTTGLLRRWREGPVLFAGDAAHWHSPWGGYGMNSGIQDANNLAWKLHLVLRGLAPEALLDTYETERKSKARLTVKAATYNSLHYQAIAEAVRVGEGEEFREGKLSSEAIALLGQLVAPHGDNSVLHTGYQLGTVYRTGALLADARTPPPPPGLRDYVETTAPGVRAPHAWLRDTAGHRVSTIELWGQRLTLAGYRLPGFWTGVCADAVRRFALDIDLLDVGAEGQPQPDDKKFAQLYAGQPGQVVLVRPDGFIAARFAPGTATQARADLTLALRHVLGMADIGAAQPAGSLAG
ncbi:MAG: FAD-dependent monooxygenase [Burkholderiales bacterium]|nr:FAD-dependent monooxygenase [Burkholderiales bacterium]